VEHSHRKQSVVVGLSGDQPELLSFAIGMAEMLDAPIRVVHANVFQDTTDRPDEGRDPGAVPHDAEDPVLAAARDRLASNADLDVEYTVRSEPPVLALEIESKDAALMVLGSDDVSWFDRLAGANVAQRVALHCGCPVIVVPPSVSQPRIDEIVVAIDVDNVVSAALDFGFDLGERTGSEVRVVTVLPEDFDVEERDWRDGRLRGYVAQSRTRFPHVKARHEVITGRPAANLIRGSLQARLVVVGRPNQPHRAPLFGPRVAAALLRRAQCMVAVVPAGPQG